AVEQGMQPAQCSSTAARSRRRRVGARPPRTYPAAAAAARQGGGRRRDALYWRLPRMTWMDERGPWSGAPSASIAGDGARADGSLAGGRYRLLGPLGAGGMGDVFEAHDRELDTVVALKRLRRVSPDGEARFKREFRALADIEHPNL